MSQGADIALFTVQFVLFLAFIFLGTWLGGLGIAFAGGLGLFIFGFFFNLGTKDPTGASYAPWDVVEIIMAVIGCISCIQAAGGMDWMVKLCQRSIQRFPRAITFVAPLVTFAMTVGSGTGHTAFSVLPVIAEVAKEQGIRPSKPLTMAVIASQVGICGSPIAAAFIVLSDLAKTYNRPEITYVKLIAVLLPSCLLGTMCGAVVAHFWGKPLAEDPVFLQRLRDGECHVRNPEKYLGSGYLEAGCARAEDDSTHFSKLQSAVRAKLSHVSNENSTSFLQRYSHRVSVFAFLAAIVVVILWNVLTSKGVEAIPNRKVTGADSIVAIMLTCATFIFICCRLTASEIADQKIFKSGAVASLCVLGVGWMGSMFIGAWKPQIAQVTGSLLRSQAWLLPFITYVAGALLYSQTITTKVIIDLGFSLNMSSAAIVCAFPAASALFVLPTYPTVIAAAELDDTGSTKLGKYLLDHPFVVPGTVAIAASCILAFGLGSVIF